MKLIFIYGPPAAGKNTIGQELAHLTKYRFFHNHLVVDAVLSLFDFGTPSFVKMRAHLWDALLNEAVSSKVEGVIFTFNPENSVPKEYIPSLLQHLKQQGADILIVKVICPESVIESRLAEPSRLKYKKLSSLDLYRELRDRDVFNDSAMPIADLEIDSSILTPTENAKKIYAYLQLS